MCFAKRFRWVLIAFITINSFLSKAIAQHDSDKKNKFFKIGLEYSIPGNGYSGCDYKVSGIGARLEREWQQNKKFSFLLSAGYQYLQGYTIIKSLGKKNFSYADITAAERFYPADKFFVQAQLGVSTWGPVTSGGLGFLIKNVEARVSYRSVITGRAAVCYKYANEEHLNFVIMYVF